MNKGFTLIELLVVVLIIGILAAIALPQYTKAVERSRMAEAVQVLGDLATAQQVYYMQHSEFAASKDALNQNGDIQLPDGSPNWVLTAAMASGTKPQSAAITLTRDGGMYDKSSLTINVAKDGSIHKCYTMDKDAAGFDSVAQAMDYKEPCIAKAVRDQKIIGDFERREELRFPSDTDSFRLLEQAQKKAVKEEVVEEEAEAALDEEDIEILKDVELKTAEKLPEKAMYMDYMLQADK